MSTLLHTLGEKYGTDKAAHGFLNLYDKTFQHFRERAHKVLEVGVFFGASVRMWKDYFPQAVIHGMDHFEGKQGNGNVFAQPNAFWNEVKNDTEMQQRVYLHRVNQADRDELQQWASKQTSGTFDMIMDDASHLMRDQQQTLGILFSLVRPGGYFVLEDVHSSLESGYDVDAKAENTTLRMIETFRNTGYFASKYMLMSEVEFLNEAVASCELLQGRPGSLTCIFKKRMILPRAVFSEHCQSGVVAFNYATLSHRVGQTEQSQWLKQWGVSDVVSFGPEDLDPSFSMQCGAILKQKRGAGYWIWKPYVILAMLRACNAYTLIYVDCSSAFRFTLDDVATRIFPESMHIRAFPLSEHLEKAWNKRDCLKAMDADRPEITDTFQTAATCILLRSVGQTDKLIQEWYHACQNDLVTDIPSIEPNYPEFREHRHDQSIFSILYKKLGLPSDLYISKYIHHHKFC